MLLEEMVSVRLFFSFVSCVSTDSLFSQHRADIFIGPKISYGTGCWLPRPVNKWTGAQWVLMHLQATFGLMWNIWQHVIVSPVQKVFFAMTSFGLDHCTANIIPVNVHNFVHYVSHNMMLFFFCVTRGSTAEPSTKHLLSSMIIKKWDIIFTQPVHSCMIPKSAGWITLF